MVRKRLNLGILAHVDAGKTTLTERLLFAAGVIDEIGSVDRGTTQTDSLALERRRGITIRSAVVSFLVGDVAVNLIDTPGHPDFIAEVERVLGVLDGAVLLVSAVEGVQPQTRVLMRALQRLRVPTLLFVNKIDRPGAECGRVLAGIADRLTPAVIATGTVTGAGTRAAAVTTFGEGDAAFATELTDLLAAGDDRLLAAYVQHGELSHARLRCALAEQVGGAAVHPVLFGSAVTGAGVGELMDGIAQLLPGSHGDPDAPAAGVVFKIDRGARGEKIAYLRLSAGSVRTRDRLRLAGGVEQKVTAIHVFDRGTATPGEAVCAGQIGRLWGLDEARIGDRIGAAGTSPDGHHFAPPTLETVVVPVHDADRARLRVALSQLAEQDPLIDVRQDDRRHEFSLSLYGEVQKEVIEATLAGDFGIEVAFRETTTICIERPVGSGAALERLGDPGNPFTATVGLRVDPAPADSGVAFRLPVDVRDVPMYVYKTLESFTGTMTGTVRHALREGLAGWRVTDCLVTMTDCGYYAPSTSASDFRKLTPLVLMRALADARTAVCEPMMRLSIELPTSCLGAVVAALTRLDARVEAPDVRGRVAVLTAIVPAPAVREIQHRLPSLTGGEGVVESAFDGYRPVRGVAPARLRTTASPLDRERYLAQLAGGGLGRQPSR